MNEQDFKKIFVTHKVDVPDQGFSERVVRQLPARKSLLPPILMAVFIMIGLVPAFVLLGIAPLLEQINSLITSIGLLQAPSLGSVITYIGLLLLTGIIGYAVAQADVG